MTTQQNVLTQNEILLHIIIYRKSAGLLKQTSTYKEHPKTTKKTPQKTPAGWLSNKQQQ